MYVYVCIYIYLYTHSLQLICLYMPLNFMGMSFARRAVSAASLDLLVQERLLASLESLEAIKMNDSKRDELLHCALQV